MKRRGNREGAGVRSWPSPVAGWFSARTGHSLATSARGGTRTGESLSSRKVGKQSPVRSVRPIYECTRQTSRPCGAWGLVAALAAPRIASPRELRSAVGTCCSGSDRGTRDRLSRSCAPRTSHPPPSPPRLSAFGFRAPIASRRLVTGHVGREGGGAGEGSPPHRAGGAGRGDCPVATRRSARRCSSLLHSHSRRRTEQPNRFDPRALPCSAECRGQAALFV